MPKMILVNKWVRTADQLLPISEIYRKFEELNLEVNLHLTGKRVPGQKGRVKLILGGGKLIVVSHGTTDLDYTEAVYDREEVERTDN